MEIITDHFKLYWHKHGTRLIDISSFHFLWQQIRKTFNYSFTCQKIKEDFIKCWISAPLGIESVISSAIFVLSQLNMQS